MLFLSATIIDRKRTQVISIRRIVYMVSNIFNRSSLETSTVVEGAESIMCVYAVGQEEKQVRERVVSEHKAGEARIRKEANQE
jgi:hypothetical protein